MALWEGEHTLMRQIDETRAEVILLLIFLDELFQVNRFVCHVLRALLVRFEAESVSALVHVHWAETEAKNIELACLSWALAIALTINHLFIVGTLSHYFQALLHARALVVYHAIGAHWRAHITLSHDKARWALWEPLLFAFLAALALFLLAVSTPQGKWLFTAFFVLLEELRASKVILNRLDFLVCKGTSLLLSLALSAALLLDWLLELLGFSSCSVLLFTGSAATVAAG